MAFGVQYMEDLSPVQESEVLVVPIWAYDLVLRLRSSAKCILVTGSLQECLRGCGV